ncbi:MAG: deaminase [Patescibacteria group bacterium]
MLTRSPDWNSLLGVAYRLAQKSPDPSTQNAALLIDESGTILGSDTNRFPDGVKNIPERWERPLKYKIVEHAERNVIFQLARQGIKIHALTMVCPWAACSDCARAIIQSGVKKLVTHKQAYDRSPDFWQQDIEIALMMLREADVEVVMYDGLIGVQGVLHSGQLWNP